MTSTILEVAVPQCVAEDFDGEIVALNMESGTYFSLKDAAAHLWNDLAAGHAVEALIERAGSGTPLGTAIEKFAAEVRREGLMRPATEPVTPNSAPTIFEGGADEQLPALTAYHDMESLLLLDPIHEVDDEEGWPKAPA